MINFKESLPVIPPTQRNMEHEELYSKAVVRSLADETIELPNNGFLAVKIHDGLHVEFVVFEYNSATLKEIQADDGQFEIIMHGIGPSGNLRECRHTYWGDSGRNGYLNYPDRKLICGAFEVLARWFDL